MLVGAMLSGGARMVTLATLSHQVNRGQPYTGHDGLPQERKRLGQVGKWTVST